MGVKNWMPKNVFRCQVHLRSIFFSVYVYQNLNLRRSVVYTFYFLYKTYRRKPMCQIAILFIEKIKYNYDHWDFQRTQLKTKFLFFFIKLYLLFFIFYLQNQWMEYSFFLGYCSFLKKKTNISKRKSFKRK